MCSFLPPGFNSSQSVSKLSLSKTPPTTGISSAGSSRSGSTGYGLLLVFFFSVEPDVLIFSIRSACRHCPMRNLFLAGKDAIVHDGWQSRSTLTAIKRSFFCRRKTLVDYPLRYLWSIPREIWVMLRFARPDVFCRFDTAIISRGLHGFSVEPRSLAKSHSGAGLLPTSPLGGG